jgi:hypothetical protein
VESFIPILAALLVAFIVRHIDGERDEPEDDE